MNRLRYYYEHSLVGYFLRRIKEKWFTLPSPPAPPLLAQVNHHGVLLQVDCLPQAMQGFLREGNYENSEMTILPGFISAEDKVLEIGGAIGFIGLYCRKVVGVKDLVSVEPNPKTLSYLRRNYELNGFNPSIIEAALNFTDGPVQFQVSDLFWTDSLASQANATETAKTQFITVQGLTFESIIKRAGIRFNALIIDIEGGEQYLPLDFLPKHVTKVLIEIHPDMIGVRQAFKSFESLIRLGFCVEGHCANSWILKRN